MDVTYKLGDIDFVWDGSKAESNFDKHGVEFTEACGVFFDPGFQILRDTTSGEEERHHIVGFSLKHQMLLVVYVERSAKTRIISARAATHTERKIYEQGS